MSGTDYTLTPNYGLFKPITGMDPDAWGGHWNQNADKLDTTLKGFLPLAGGTMLGDLILNRDPTLAAQAATKSYVDINTITPAAGDARWVNVTGDTMTGPLNVAGSLTITSAGWTSLLLTRPAGQGVQIVSYTGSNARWTITPGDATAESGGNAGSDFFIGRFDDAGTYLGTPFGINRATGAVNIAQTLGVGGALNVNGLTQVNNHILAQVPGGNAFVGSYHSGNNSVVGIWNGSNVLYFGNADGLGVPSASRAYIDAGGTLNITGNFVSQGYIMNTGGVMYVAGNYNYYMGRDNANGLWRIVDNGNVLFSMDASGGASFNYGLSSPFVTGTTSVRASSDGTFQLYIVPGGSPRRIAFANEWSFDWDGTSGDLNWLESGVGATHCFRSGDRAFISWLGPNYATSFNPLSDERMKTEMTPADVGLKEVLALEPIRFRRVDFNGLIADRTEIGFGARQIQSIMPDGAVPLGTPRPGMPGALGSDDPIMAYSIPTVLAALVNAVKTLHARLDVIETGGAA